MDAWAFGRFAHQFLTKKTNFFMLKRIGIICEGRSDLAVLQNILKAYFPDLDKDNFVSIAPEYYADRTDLAEMKKEEFGSWTLVQKNCEEGDKIRYFIENANLLEGKHLLIIHIDADVRQNYGVIEPADLTNKDDIQLLRQNIVNKLQSWLAITSIPTDNILYAVAIQNIESWILTIYTSAVETGFWLNTKDKLNRELNKKPEKERTKLFSNNQYDFALLVSKDFQKLKNLKKFQKQNQSLADFLEELENHI